MNQDYQLLKAAVRELKEDFKKYLEKQTKSTGATEICLQTLSEKCNVHKMKLMQLLHWTEKERADFISVDEIVYIIKHMSCSSTYSEILKSAGIHGRKLLKAKRSAYSESLGNDIKVKVPVHILLDFDNWLVLLLASVRTKLSDVMRIIDSQVLLKLSSMENLGLVEIRNGLLSLVGGDDFETPLSVLRDHLPRLEKQFYKLSDTENNLIFLFYEKTNERGRLKVRKAYTDFIATVSKVVASEKGDIPIF